jgi:hypothetical protein
LTTASGHGFCPLLALREALLLSRWNLGLPQTHDPDLRRDNARPAPAVARPAVREARWPILALTQGEVLRPHRFIAERSDKLACSANNRRVGG